MPRDPDYDWPLHMMVRAIHDDPRCYIDRADGGAWMVGDLPELANSRFDKWADAVRAAFTALWPNAVPCRLGFKSLGDEDPSVAPYEPPESFRGAFRA